MDNNQEQTYDGLSCISRLIAPNKLVRERGRPTH